MTTKMTERDKKLIVFVVIVAILALFIFVAIRPLVKKIQTADESITAAEQTKADYEQKQMLLPSLRVTHEALIKRIHEAYSDYYQTMNTDEVGNMMLEMILKRGLFSRDFSVSIADDTTVAPYAYSGRAKLSGTAQSGKSRISVASVTMTVTGDKAELQKFVDSLSLDYPAIRITTETLTGVASYQWDTVNGENTLKTGGKLAISLQIYMHDFSEDENIDGDI